MNIYSFVLQENTYCTHSSIRLCYYKKSHLLYLRNNRLWIVEINSAKGKYVLYTQQHKTLLLQEVASTLRTEKPFVDGGY
jgi:hypothetical protein